MLHHAGAAPEGSLRGRLGSRSEEEVTAAGVWGLPWCRGAPLAVGKHVESMGPCRELDCWASPRGAVQRSGSENGAAGRSGRWLWKAHRPVSPPIAPQVFLLSHNMITVLSASQGKLKNPMHEIQSQSLLVFTVFITLHFCKCFSTVFTFLL